jgi:hypothetical protein
VRHATQWELTEFACDDHVATKDFIRWQPTEKKNTVPLGGTNGPSRRDTRSTVEGPTGNNFPKLSLYEGPSTPKMPPHGPSRRDTYKLPGSSGSLAARTSTAEPLPAPRPARVLSAPPLKSESLKSAAVASRPAAARQRNGQRHRP